MKFDENSLLQGEHIKYTGQIHPFIFVYPVCLLFIGLFLGRIGIIFFLPGLYILLKSYLKKITFKYIVTNKRIIFKTGIFKQTFLVFTSDRYKEIEFKQSTLGRLAGFGKIVLIENDRLYSFSYITNATQFQTEINHS